MNKPARQADLLNGFNKSTRRANHLKVRQALRVKIFRFSEVENQIISLPSRPIQMGVAQGRQCGTGMRWTRMALLTRAPEADGKDVWSRHPQAGVKFAA